MALSHGGHLTTRGTRGTYVVYRRSDVWLKQRALDICMEHAQVCQPTSVCTQSRRRVLRVAVMVRLDAGCAAIHLSPVVRLMIFLLSLRIHVKREMAYRGGGDNGFILHIPGISQTVSGRVYGSLVRTVFCTIAIHTH